MRFSNAATDRAVELAARATEVEPANKELWRIRALAMFADTGEYNNLDIRNALDYSAALKQDERQLRVDEAVWQKFVKQAQQHDPENALYDYLECARLFAIFRRTPAGEFTHQIYSGNPPPVGTLPTEIIARLKQGDRKPMLAFGDRDAIAVVPLLRRSRLPKADRARVAFSQPFEDQLDKFFSLLNDLHWAISRVAASQQDLEQLQWLRRHRTRYFDQILGSREIDVHDLFYGPGLSAIQPVTRSETFAGTVNDLTRDAQLQLDLGTNDVEVLKKIVLPKDAFLDAKGDAIMQIYFKSGYINGNDPSFAAQVGSRARVPSATREGIRGICAEVSLLMTVVLLAIAAIAFTAIRRMGSNAIGAALPTWIAVVCGGVAVMIGFPFLGVFPAGMIARSVQMNWAGHIAWAVWVPVACIPLAFAAIGVRAFRKFGLKFDLQTLLGAVTVCAIFCTAIVIADRISMYAWRGEVGILFPERGWRELGPKYEFTSRYNRMRIALPDLRHEDTEPATQIVPYRFGKHIAEELNIPYGTFRYAIFQWLVGYGPFITIPLALSLIAVMRWYTGRQRGDRAAEPPAQRIAGFLQSAYRSCFSVALACLAIHLACVPAIFPEIEATYQSDMAHLRDPDAHDRQVWKKLEPEIVAYCKKYGIKRSGD